MIEKYLNHDRDQMNPHQMILLIVSHAAFHLFGLALVAQRRRIWLRWLQSSLAEAVFSQEGDATRCSWSD